MKLKENNCPCRIARYALSNAGTNDVHYTMKGLFHLWDACKRVDKPVPPPLWRWGHGRRRRRSVGSARSYGV